MSKAVNIIFPVFLYAFQGYCLQYFYGSFLEIKGKGNWWNAGAVAVLYTVLRLILSWMGSSDLWDYKVAIGRMALALGILAFLAVCFYKAFCLTTVFLVVAFQAVADISRYAVVILLGELGDGMIHIWSWCAEKGVFASERSFGITVNAGLIGEWILEYLGIALLMYGSLKKIVRDFREKEYDINRAELLFILTPAAAGLMICLLLRIIIITMENGIPKILYDRYPVLIVLIPAILLLSLLSILHGVKLFQDMVYSNRERSARIILEKQVMNLQEHIEEMERVYSGIRSMKHDMKNTLCVIQRLFDRDREEENQELQIYLADLNRAFEKLEISFKTGNTIVDILLNMKYHEAVRQVPDLKMNAERLFFPQNLKIRSYDIGVVLGNALDNAIEACQKLKKEDARADTFIRLSSLQKGSLLILKVENSFDGRLVKKQKEDFPATEKADKNAHGIGLANIKSTAEKYQGTMDFRIEGRVFILSVMMKSERRNEDGFWSNQ